MAFNKVILIGNLGKDPEVKVFQDGNKVASFSLATTEKGFKTKSGIDVPEKTQWHNIVVKGALAEVVEKYVHKGDKLCVEGKLEYRSYGEEAAKKYMTEIIVSSMEMLTAKSTSAPEPKDEPKQTSEPFSSGQQDDLPF